MATPPSENQLRAAFKLWALKQITSAPDHPLQCLVEKSSGQWHPNAVGSESKPSVDAGHLTSKWTGAPPFFALEDSDFNRVFNKGENKTRHGVIYEKSAVLIGGVPVERRTAQMLENVAQKPDRTPAFPKGTVAGAPVVKGAVYIRGGEFGIVQSGDGSDLIESPTVTSIKSNASLKGKLGELASNQDAVALVGESLGQLQTWLTYRNITVEVKKQLRTSYATEINNIFGASKGVLVVVRVQRWANPSPDYRMDTPSLSSLNIVGGTNVEQAMSSWKQPSILQGAPQGFEIVENYFWLTKSNFASFTQD